jgi:hypothetical protein
MFVHASITAKRHSCYHLVPPVTMHYYFDPPAAEVPGYTGLCGESATRSPRYRSTSSTPSIVRAVAMVATRHWKPSPVRQLVAGNLTCAKAQPPGHHRHLSVQSSITYLCIGLGLRELKRDSSMRTNVTPPSRRIASSVPPPR